MKFAIASEHRDFFQKQRTIEFENLLTEKQMSALTEGVENALLERLGVDPQSATPGKQFIIGHDLWRSSAQVKKIIMQRQLAQCAADLTEASALRFGYDQLFPELRGRTYRSAISDAYHQLLNHPATLNGISSLQGIACGLMLCLQGDHTGHAETGSVFTTVPGNGVFIHPDFVLDFQYLMQHPMQRYLLIVYTNSKAFYSRNDADPHTHALKPFGYNFGEKLSDKFHPMVCR